MADPNEQKYSTSNQKDEGASWLWIFFPVIGWIILLVKGIRNYPPVGPQDRR